MTCLLSTKVLSRIVDTISEEVIPKLINKLLRFVLKLFVLSFLDNQYDQFSWSKHLIKIFFQKRLMKSSGVEVRVWLIKMEKK